MKTAEEVFEAMEKLPEEEQAKLKRWLAEYREEILAGKPLPISATNDLGDRI